jgi:isopentenyl-diphosphate Delta-isomerase
MNYIPLVDEKNNLLGEMDKMEVHEKGLLHRAFSLFVFDKEKRLFIQKRADEKYHSPGLWSNTSCSHPENNLVKKREIANNLYREMGMNCGRIIHLYDFIYRKEFSNGLIEHELDSVYLSFSNEKLKINPLEVSMAQQIPLKRLYEEIEGKPWKYTFWFKEILEDERFKEGLEKFGIL